MVDWFSLNLLNERNLWWSGTGSSPDMGRYLRSGEEEG